MLYKDCVVKCQNGFDYVLVKKKKDGWLAFPVLQLESPPVLRTYTTIKESEMIKDEEWKRKSI